MSQQAPLVIGIDFGGTSVKMGVVRGSEIIDQAPPIPTQGFDSSRDLLHAMEREISNLRSRYPEIAAVGIGLPGVVDFHTGVLADLTNVPGWVNTPVKAILTEAVGLPIVTDNDAHCMAYAEWKLGAARGKKDVFCVTLGTGVGGGIICDGKLIRGNRFGAGSIGQMSIDMNGRVGEYGNKGALEDYIGNREIIKTAREMYLAKHLAPPAELSPATLTAAAKNGDPVALEVWDYFAERLATALMNCLYLINPEMIVIGGGVARAGDILFTPLRKYLDPQVQPAYLENLSIVPAHFGSESGILGAAVLAVEELEK